jgi:hypothetical protein
MNRYSFHLTTQIRHGLEIEAETLEEAIRIIDADIRGYGDRAVTNAITTMKENTVSMQVADVVGVNRGESAAIIEPMWNGF